VLVPSGAFRYVELNSNVEALVATEVPLPLDWEGPVSEVYAFVRSQRKVFVIAPSNADTSLKTLGISASALRQAFLKIPTTLTVQ
jgi:hypothetical protein